MQRIQSEQMMSEQERIEREIQRQLAEEQEEARLRQEQEEILAQIQRDNAARIQ